MHTNEEQLNTISDFINLATDQFEQSEIYFGHGTDNAWDEAVYLVLSVLDLPLDSDQSVWDKELGDHEQEILLKAIYARIKDRVPVPYLMEKAWFAGLPFYVNQNVLIPRSPLAESILNQFAPWVDPEKVSQILDIGTGSGCIAIAAAYAFPDAKVDAVDISDEALEVAAKNCKRHGMLERVRPLKSDLFENLEGKTYDLIISNPPYVGESEMEMLPEEYSHEPSLALLAGDNGTEIVDRIIAEAPKYLAPSGILVVEVGNSAPIIMEKYPELPFTWLEFEYGEGEVFLLTREQLLEAL